MYYFKETNENIEKYEVLYDKEVINKLKMEIINNCSRIVHHAYIGTRNLYHEGNYKIINYESKRVAVNEYNDGPAEDIYRFSYDKYEYPYLVNLIDKLLVGNSDVIEEIFNPDFDKERDLSFSKLIELISKEIDEINNVETERKIEKLNELEQLLASADLNKNQVSVNSYYLELQKLITMNLVDRIDKKEIIRVRKFFND